MKSSILVLTFLCLQLFSTAQENENQSSNLDIKLQINQAVNLNPILSAETIEEGNYYYAWATLREDPKLLYITPVLFISKSDCPKFGITHNIDIRNQFEDYMNAEYNGVIELRNAVAPFDVVGKPMSKAEVVARRRAQMNQYERLIKIEDFEFFCAD